MTSVTGISYGLCFVGGAMFGLRDSWVRAFGLVCAFAGFALPDLARLL